MSETPGKELHNIIRRPFADLGGQHVGVAVSGGGDSMALLDLVYHWSVEARAQISAVTIDHGLRSGSADEAAMVAKFCAGRRVEHDVLRWDGWNGKGNLQAAAREARYRLIADWAKSKDVATVCLAHTCDDQAETFLMRLARKAGSDGLRAMSREFERYGVRWVRPFLGRSREELRVHLRREGIDWIDDPSNEDARFDRVKARRVLKALEPLGIDAESLSAVAHYLAQENDVLRQATHDALKGRVTEDRGALSISQGDFLELGPVPQRRFLVAAIGWIAGGDYAPRSLSLSGFAKDLVVGQTHTLAGVIGWKAKGRIWLAREHERVRGETGNPFDGRWRIDGPLEGLEIRALGPEGLKQLPDWRELDVPRRVLLPTPGVWKGEWLIAAPLAGKPNRQEVTLLRPSFDNWLMQH